MHRITKFAQWLYIKVIQEIIKLASVKGIGGSCEPLARIYLHSSPNPSFGKGGALAVEILFIDSLFLCLAEMSFGEFKEFSEFSEPPPNTNFSKFPNLPNIPIRYLPRCSMRIRCIRSLKPPSLKNLSDRDNNNLCNR